ncbi:uncharacterized protein LOC143866141 [Tasmannia lanceolata]|uniref:uncharacterized protein LOC143866141 n=1 Tax=Tasmannia lanceolata TaxID=3420 RepID=UPI0040642D91
MSKAPHYLYMRIIALVINWTRCHQSFRFVSAYDLWEGWGVVCLSSEWANKVVQRWEPPPQGVLKINFDGACFGNPGPAGVGGLCRDDAGKILWSFWGPLGVTDATEAEVQAAFNGIKKVSMDCPKSVIVEGNSFNVIRWLRGGMAPPWRFLDLFDEMEDILVESDIELIHVRRSANEKADALARRGVVCISMNWSDQFPI